MKNRVPPCVEDRVKGIVIFYLWGDGEEGKELFRNFAIPPPPPATVVKFYVPP